MKDYNQIIENFCQKDFVTDFLNKNKEVLELNSDIEDLHLDIHHKRNVGTGRRLIVTYNFKHNGQKQSLTGKIRIYKDTNLGKKGWVMSKGIWDKIEGKYEYIPKPLHYFEEYDLFIYRTALGKTLDNILKNQNLDKEEVSKKIKISAEHLAELHRIDITGFEDYKFREEYQIMGQLKRFYNFLKISKLSCAPELRDIVHKTRELLKEFAKPTSLIHGDFQIENFVFNENSFKLIDFDFVEINDPLADVGNFLVQIFYGGVLGDNVDYHRQEFLDTYLENNLDLDRTNLNTRINLFTSLAKIRNINNKVMFPGGIKRDEKENIKHDLKRIKRRLNDLEHDPIDFFKKPVD